MFGGDLEYAAGYDLDSGMTFFPESIPTAAVKPPLYVVGPRWTGIRPRSVINAVPPVVFYPAVFAGFAWLAMNENRWAPRGYGPPLWFIGGAFAWSAYNKASLDVGRVVRGEWTWDDWEKAHPILRHLWAFCGRFSK
jgi:hypothetical protein